MTSATNPESGIISYQYDSNGNLLVKTDARTASAHYSYDALNRPTRRWYNGSSALADTTNNVPALPSGVGATDEVHLKKITVSGNVVDAHANVEAAWALSDGTGATIALIDDGVDLDHQESQSSGKIIAPRDVTRKTDNPRPGNGDNHGTAWAGVACADGNFGASGVAPKARLIPIRLASALGSQNEADAFV